MKKITVIVSLIIHGGVAVALLTASQHRASGKSFFVQLAEAKKKEVKEKAKVAPPKPKVAKVEHPVEKHLAAPKLAPVHEAPPPVARAITAPIAMDVAMSNEDIGDAVAIPVVARAAQAAVPTRVASVDAEPRRRRMHELGPGGPVAEEHCSEEPSKPEPVYKTENRIHRGGARGRHRGQVEAAGGGGCGRRGGVGRGSVRRFSRARRCGHRRGQALAFQTCHGMRQAGGRRHLRSGPALRAGGLIAPVPRRAHGALAREPGCPHAESAGSPIR